MAGTASSGTPTMEKSTASGLALDSASGRTASGPENAEKKEKGKEGKEEGQQKEVGV